MGRDCQSQGFKAQNPGTVQMVFVPVPRVSGICVPWDDSGTARILRAAWASSPTDRPSILDSAVPEIFVPGLSKRYLSQSQASEEKGNINLRQIFLRQNFLRQIFLRPIFLRQIFLKYIYSYKCLKRICLKLICLKLMFVLKYICLKKHVPQENQSQSKSQVPGFASRDTNPMGSWSDGHPCLRYIKKNNYFLIKKVNILFLRN